MCGIAGAVRARDRAIDRARLIACSSRIKHRGPDDEGYVLFSSTLGRAQAMTGPDSDPSLSLPRVSDSSFTANAALAHRRLSIIDLTPAGHQPMSSADGRYWIALNGEIYNYLELRVELQTRGAVFRSKSDTEVLLAAFEAWGPEMLPKLIGMFSVAILDTHQQRLFLARDQFGIKPLYYAVAPGEFAFASEATALFEFPFVQRRADAKQTYQHLRFGERSTFSDTLLADVRSLPPAHSMAVSLDDASISTPLRFWGLRSVQRRSLTCKAAAEELRHLLDESVRLHLRSDVPVGACFSGGLDSSALLALALRQLPASSTVQACSFISEDRAFSEEKWIDMMEGATVHKTRPTAAEFASDVNALVAAHDFPFMNLSIYAQYRVFRLAHEMGLKVMLDGQGSDELFGGYASLIGVRVTSLLAQGKLGEAVSLARRVPNTIPFTRINTLWSSLGRQLPSAWQLRAVDHLGGGLFPNWLNRAWFSERGVEPSIRPHGRGADAFHDELLLCLEQVTLPQLLRYEDSNSMRFSIESRVPFCTAALAEFAMSLPDDLLIAADGTTKRVLRDAAEGLVPDSIIYRPKFGFNAPDRQWLLAARETIDEWLLPAHMERMPFLNREAVRKLVDSGLASQGYCPPQIWGVLGLVAWGITNEIFWD
jgi:asparagine synthase (glutamine-hydrolysing)